MGKTKKGKGVQRGEKSDFTLEQRLKKENRQLKQQVKQLKNFIEKRCNPQRLEHLERLAAEQREVDKDIKKNKDKARDKWLCDNCGKGYMIPRIFKRRDGDFYYRLCNNTECEHRTRMKKLTDDVDLSLLGEE